MKSSHLMYRVVRFSFPSSDCNHHTVVVVVFSSCVLSFVPLSFYYRRYHHVVVIFSLTFCRSVVELMSLSSEHPSSVGKVVLIRQLAYSVVPSLTPYRRRHRMS